ncbi:lactate dehydrogenase [Candidatus Nitrosotenuis chungbukensis]|uniref:malate dehydrogenase n=1 Tax=Candidatus Nitrosotenuis chungbukensis TaxID=1353246 RepID=UPI0005B2B2E6|nr:lactate dehydrogenase [Candidatus Nitrosotenuis chungbukensis]WKT58651.1 lactate dehydrogenase [Candidatus Nitrosotenuis chungbukensis]
MISIIGAGKVGSAAAFLCGSFSLDDIVLINRDEKKAIGEAFDITNAIPASSSISITGTSDYSKIKDSKVIVITASSGIHLQSRSEIMYDQAKMIQKIASNIVKYAPDSKILMITNPVDVLTYVVQKETSFSPKNVIGVASSLDSGRFRYLLAQEFGANQSEIQNAMVMGEHDDTMVPIFSQAKYNGKPVTNFLDDAQILKITLAVRNYWKYLRDYKGHSAFGIAKNTFDIIKSIIKDETLDVPASVLLDGQYGLYDVCIGIPLTISKNGVDKTHQIEITQNEKESLSKSAYTVKNNIIKVLDFLKN